MNVRTYKSPHRAAQAVVDETPTVLFNGDCLALLQKLPSDSVDMTITSPPYCMGKAYETSRSVDDFIAAHEAILPEIARVTKMGGSICWQVGYHVTNRHVYPLDYPIFSIMSELDDVILRNRIIWSFGFGMHQTNRFSGRHETVLWFTKGEEYYFDLDAVRTPQKYPGKRRYKGPNRGEFSCNPKGKNPADLWDIPNVKAAHVEKLDHPCQFPFGLADRLVRATSPKNGLVFDPFCGSGTSGVAAVLNGRRFLGAEIDPNYAEMAKTRLLSAHAGTVRVRPVEQPLYVSQPTDAVSHIPSHFIKERSKHG